MSQDTEQRIRDIVARHRPEDAPPILPGATLKELGIDSLNAIEILFDIEEHFGIEVPEERYADFENVGDIADLIIAMRDHGRR